MSAEPQINWSKMIDVTEISKVGGEVWQRTVAQFLVDTKA